MKSAINTIKILFLALNLVFASHTLAQASSAAVRCEKISHLSFKQIKLSEIEKLEKKGRFLVGSFKNSNVFIKQARGGGLTEALWLEKLNMLGLGPKFYGLTEVNGEPAIVLERVAGFNTQLPDLSPIDFVMKPKHVAEMRRQFEILLKNKIDALDLQFLIDPATDKVTLIDPEFYTLTTEYVYSNSEMYFNNIILNWRMSGKLAE
jgi:hypothetical protein